MTAREDAISLFELEPDRDLQQLAVLVLRNQALLPGQRETFHIARPESLAVITSMGGEHPVLAVFTQRHPWVDSPGAADLRPIGVLARVTETREHSPGNYALTLEGQQRIRLESLTREGSCPTAHVALVESAPPVEEGAVTAFRDRALQTLRAMPDEHRGRVQECADLGELTDLVGAVVKASVAERATLLETLDPGERAQTIADLMDKQIGWQKSLSEMVFPAGDTIKDLWALQPGSEAQITEAVAAGSMTRAEADHLTHFAEKGYVIREGLIEHELIDALLDDIRRIGEHPGRFLSTDFRRSLPFRYTSDDFDSFESIFDLYINYESARQVCFHPEVLRFLELLFGEKPMAFQQLLFQRSNGHPMHQDTAYVCVAEPMYLAATWIALEDVVPGRGELAYYEGSHRIPHHVFANGSKHYNPDHDNGEEVLRQILGRCEEMGCEQRTLIAKKGDVFFWAADLVHGSSPRTRPEEETRLSCVTHYCPESVNPLWMWLWPEHRNRQAYGDRALMASSHYRLPTTGGLAHPHFREPLPS